MKRVVLLLPAALGGVLTVAAQDLIVKTDRSSVEARVMEITPETVRYKRFSNPDGPTYVLPVGDIEYIRYANGEEERFRQPGQPAREVIPATPLVPATPVETAASEPVARSASRQYDIGEYYDRDGVKGVVCALSPDKTHGLLLSLDEIYLHWSEFRKPDLCVVGADDRSDGMANMQQVAAYIEANGGSWEDFPAFKWCREQGEGWYLPSIDELVTIGHNYNGGTRVQNNKQARNKFNGMLKEQGGKRMDRLVYYFSSTEKDEKSAYTTHMGIEPPYVIEIPKYNKFLVRAVRRF
ncbi:MAG: hypothetical protein K2I59_08225 [Alistipes sp.]|nr:hypothetical protein [Alistipes sp.]